LATIKYLLEQASSVVLLGLSACASLYFFLKVVATELNKYVRFIYQLVVSASHRYDLHYQKSSSVLAIAPVLLFVKKNWRVALQISLSLVC
jgi:hypothetical protein